MAARNVQLSKEEGALIIMLTQNTPVDCALYKALKPLAYRARAKWPEVNESTFRAWQAHGQPSLTQMGNFEEMWDALKEKL